MSDDAPVNVEALAPVAQALDDLRIEYHIGESIASSFHGMARSTVDVDFVARLDSSHVERFVAKLAADDFVDAEMIREAIRSRSSFYVIHLPTMYKIDVFIPGARRLDAAAEKRVVRGRLPGGGDRLYPLASAEDVILNKLEWFKQGGEISERQWLDVIGVIRVQDEAIDRQYLAKWAAELGVGDLLDRAFREAVI